MIKVTYYTESERTHSATMEALSPISGPVFRAYYGQHVPDIERAAENLAEDIGQSIARIYIEEPEETTV